MCVFLCLNNANEHLNADCSNYTFPGAFVRGINKIRILIRQPYSGVQKEQLNE